MNRLQQLLPSTEMLTAAAARSTRAVQDGGRYADPVSASCLQGSVQLCGIIGTTCGCVRIPMLAAQPGETEGSWRQKPSASQRKPAHRFHWQRFEAQPCLQAHVRPCQPRVQAKAPNPAANKRGAFSMQDEAYDNDQCSLKDIQRTRSVHF
jgi:hypothetical protein